MIRDLIDFATSSPVEFWRITTILIAVIAFAISDLIITKFKGIYRSARSIKVVQILFWFGAILMSAAIIMTLTLGIIDMIQGIKEGIEESAKISLAIFCLGIGMLAIAIPIALVLVIVEPLRRPKRYTQ